MIHEIIDEGDFGGGDILWNDLPNDEWYWFDYGNEPFITIGHKLYTGTWWCVYQQVGKFWFPYEADTHERQGKGMRYIDIKLKHEHR